MTYAKRTCSVCGYRDIQPNMKQKTIEVESGRSKDDGSWATYIAATFMKDEAAARRINRTTWANNKRKYYRNKTVWVCKSNCGKHSDKEEVTYVKPAKPKRSRAKIRDDKLDELEMKIADLQEEENKEVVVAKSLALDAELERLDREINYNFFDWVVHYTWKLIKFSFYTVSILCIALVAYLMMGQ